MKALTKPEKFRAMSRIYGYEEDSVDEVFDGTEWVWVGWETDFGPTGRIIIYDVYDCQSTTEDSVC